VSLEPHLLVAVTVPISNSVLHGAIEHVTIDTKVDIIVSEWMGYCLLYENMLPSVIYARDNYLKHGGLLIPAQTSLRIAPFSSPDYVHTRRGFWNNVYGFDMAPMGKGISNEVDCMTAFLPEHIPAKSSGFLCLDLYATKVSDLTFANAPFTLQLDKDVPSLDGFVIWFDTFFLPPKSELVPLQITPNDFDVDKSGKARSMGTGPFEPRTHWNQSALLIDTKGAEPVPLKKGTIVSGDIGYKFNTSANVGLEITVHFNVQRHFSGTQKFNVLPYA